MATDELHSRCHIRGSCNCLCAYCYRHMKNKPVNSLLNFAGSNLLVTCAAGSMLHAAGRSTSKKTLYTDQDRFAKWLPPPKAESQQDKQEEKQESRSNADKAAS